jgi:hypothetical protein
MPTTLFTQNIIACIWDFDKTLIPDYMQSPLFRRYGVNEANFWAEANGLTETYRKRGHHISSEIAYLNHLLTYVLAGQMPKLNHRVLRECGAEIQFYPGMPEFFSKSREWMQERPEYQKHELQLEHYIVSTGLGEMIQGSAAAKCVDGVWACEFIENPLQPGFLKQKELEITAEAEIAQIGLVIDNTTKTRALFEINKGTNKNPAIDVNANIAPEDRRIPFQNMIYIADGPSDIPSFSVVKKGGGKGYAVYNPARPRNSRKTTGCAQWGASTTTARPITRRAARPGTGCGCTSRRSATASSPIARPPSPSAFPARPGISTPRPRKKPRKAGGQAAEAGK